MTIVSLLIFAVPPVGSKKFEPPVLKLLSTLSVISTSAGSRRYVPCPSPPAASTVPKTCKLFLLEVSTNPPKPVSEPVAEIEPWKLVKSSLHTITLPPLPVSNASAVISAPSSITVAEAFGSGPLPK